MTWDVHGLQGMAEKSTQHELVRNAAPPIIASDPLNIAAAPTLPSMISQQYQPWKRSSLRADVIVKNSGCYCRMDCQANLCLPKVSLNIILNARNLIFV